MKKFTMVSILSIGVILSACSGTEEEQTLSPVKSGKKIEHIHGMAISADSTTYVATHEGLFSTQDVGDTWNKVGTFDADLMGFHLKSDGTMITSGHPGPKTDLPNPLGFLTSKDKGYNWDALEYVGKIDFHLLTSSLNNPDIIYGINQMGTGKYGAGLYTSKDGGKEWEKIVPTGMPEDMHQVYSLMVMPDDDSKLLAGTENGLLISADGGKTFNIFDKSRLITA
ncbi:MAG TPA: sialidase family protein, partial [Pseudoneobacillus sp.]|nr:sialidase family protein [Pseudoneobacillus sp.]